MKIDSTIFPFCLYDTHRFQKCRTLAEAAQGCGEEEETEMYLEYHLITHFLFRMHRDPGFHQYVLNSVAHDEQIIQRTSHYLKKLFYDWICDLPSYYLPAPDVTGQSDVSPEGIIDGVVAQYENNPVPFESTASFWVNTKYSEYLSHLTSHEQDDLGTSVLRDLMSNPFVHNKWGMLPFHSTVDTANKTSRMILKKKSKHFLNGLLEFSDYLLKEEQGKTVSSFRILIESANIWNKSFKSVFDASNQKSSIAYGDDTDLSPLFCITPFLKEVRVSFASEFNIQVPGDLWADAEKFHSFNQKTKQDYVGFLKFTTDALKIASEFWFSGMDKDKKIALLNDEYPFEADAESLGKWPLKLVDEFANELCEREDYEDARSLFRHCQERAVTDIDRFYFNIALGHCSRQLKDFRFARDHYTAAHAIISHHLENACWLENVSCCIKRRPHSAKYWQLLSKVIVTEMNYHLGKTGAVKKEIDHVLSKAGYLSDPERHALLLEVSYVCENTHNQGRELRVLERLLKESHVDENTHDYVVKRYSSLNKFSGSSKRESLDKQQEINNLIKNMALINKQIIAMRSFQFTRMLKCSRQIYEFHQETSPESPQQSFIIATALFYLQRYRDAFPFYQEYLSKCTISEYDPLMGVGYPGICLIRDGEEEEGIRILKAEVTHLNKLLPHEEAGETIRMLLHNVAVEMLILGKGTTQRVLESLADAVEGCMPYEKSTYYISSAYANISWFSKAIERIDRLLEKMDLDENNRAVLLFQKGSLNNANGNLDAALSCYQEAEKSYVYSLPGKERANLMKQMADVYIKKMSYTAARKCLDTALKCYPEDTDVERIRSDIDNFLGNHLSIESVQDRVARYSLKTAEKEALELYREIGEDDEFDFSPPLMNYAKGLERLLENMVWDNIRGKVLEEFSTDESYGIPKKYFSGLPSCWKGSLNRYEDRRKTVSLGTWAGMELDHSNHNPVLKAVCRHIREAYGNKFVVITNACSFLAPYRNEIAHGGIKEKSELLEVRSKVITHLNAVISLLYGPKGSEELNSTFTKEHGDIVLVEKAIEHANTGEYEMALEYYCQAVEVDPTNIDAHIGKGQIYTKLGDYNKAETCLDIASQFDPEDSDVLHAKGCLYFEKGDYGLAAQQFQAVIKIDPSHDMAMLNLGCMFREMFENRMAFQCFEDGRGINPENEYLEAEYQSCIRAIETTENGLQHIEEKICSDPDDGSLHNTKGFLLYTLGKYEDALHCFDSAIELSYNDSNLWLYRGQTLLRLNRSDEANQSFEKSGMVKSDAI